MQNQAVGRRTFFKKSRYKQKKGETSESSRGSYEGSSKVSGYMVYLKRHSA